MTILAPTKARRQAALLCMGALLLPVAVATISAGGIAPRAPGGAGGIVGEQWRRKWHAAAVSGGDERIGEDLRGSSQVEVQRMSGGGEISLAVPEHLQSTLAWSQVSVTLTKKKSERILLNDVAGWASPGRLLAIMGPSGSGKTTLLNCLAGQLVQAKGLSLVGNVALNDESVASNMGGVRKAYVRQEDIFYSQMTVRETLRFSARLRLPKTMPLEDKYANVEEIITKLSLGKCADSIVGGAKVRGISGGERKRLNIGCELIGSPSLLFLDEPTTGLDSFQAEKVVASLRALADLGHTVVCVIHQPSGAVFNTFDDLLLLSEGRMVYHGPTKSVASFLYKQGYSCPSGINIGEFCLKVVSVDHENSDTEESSQERIKLLETSFKQSHKTAAVVRQPSSDDIEDVVTILRRGRPEAGLLEQSRLLLARSWREVTRNKAALAIQASQQVTTALIYGGIYSLGDSQKSIQDRLGLLSLVAIGNTNLALAATVRSFPKEKSIVQSERAKNLYGALPYFVSKVIAEAPVAAALSGAFGSLLYPLVGFQQSWPKFLSFLTLNVVHSFTSSALGLLLGAISPSSDVALALLPPVIVLQIIFNGFNIAEENTPKFLWLLPRISVVRWGFQGFCINEFSDLKFRCDLKQKRACVYTGEEALGRLSNAFEKSSVKQVIGAQLGILAACYLQTYNVLRTSGPQYAQMKPPPHA